MQISVSILKKTDATQGRWYPQHCASHLLGWALLGFALALSGCASDQGAPVANEMAVAEPASFDPAEDRMAYEFHVLAGEMAIQRGQRLEAAQQYVAALQYSGDIDLARRATRIALFAGQPVLAYRAAEAWADIAPQALDAQRTAARLALSVDDSAGLLDYGRALIAAAPSRDEGYRLLADGLSGGPPRADLAVDTIRELARDHPQLPVAQYALGLVALRYNRLDIARDAAQRALALAPEWDEAVLLQAGLWIREGKTGEAQALIADLPGNDATRSEYHLALARLLLEGNRGQSAISEFERALELQPGNDDARYGLAILSLSLNDLDRAEAAFMTLYEEGERADEAAYYLGTIHEQRDAYQQAQRWYQRVESGGQAFSSQVRAARMRYEQGDLAGAREQLVELRDIYPEMADQLFAAEGQLLYEAGEYRAALALYDNALSEAPDEDDLLYGRSIVYEKLGRVDDAEADLRTMLAQDANDPRALNALGYLLTNHGTRYDEALEYIAQALESDPDNPAILDSMGWVQYRLGNLDRARHYLERAYQAYPDPEVAAHLGEVLWRQGQRDAARRIWQESLEENPGHNVLEQTIARFTS